MSRLHNPKAPKEVFEIRPFVPKDLERIVELTLEGFRGVSIDFLIDDRFGPVQPGWEARKAVDVRQAAGRAPEGIFVATVREEVVGYVTVELAEEKSIGRIPDLVVDARYRRLKIGSALIQTALQYIKTSGMRLAKIETLANNDIGQTAYPKLGFVEVARQVHYVMPTEVIVDGKVDLEALRDLLGDHVEASDARDEQYSFTWPGKARARRMAQTPPVSTLKPRPEESVNWDATKNVFIEGDNLEGLKLLQESYHQKVKMIYIDPPYNTGREFVYFDKFQDHTHWLNMMYPRLYLARSLLREDGVIFISIDDHEMANLRKMCDEIFGEENFVATLTWETKRAARGVPPKTLLMENHEYILCYSGGGEVRFRGLDRDTADFGNPDNDPRGLWRSESMKATGGQNNWFSIVDPKTGHEFYGNWAFSEATLKNMIDNDLVIFPKDGKGTPRQKKFIDSYTNETKAFVTSLGWYSTEKATADFMKLFDGRKVFDFPKPLDLMKFLCEQTLSPGDIALDFFAGSATTAHAILELQLANQVPYHFIMVQLPEACDDKSEAYKAGYRTIADIGKDRIRRVLQQVEEPHCGIDLGFKVFHLVDHSDFGGSKVGC